jgi:hypothetical protein
VEILDRRIGANELYTQQVVLVYVDAQNGYLQVPHDRHKLDRASRTEKAQALDAAAQLVVRGRRYWLQLTPRSWNALCWMVVGLVTMVSG